ncbi:MULTISPECIES: hypothetical protein [unclassified Pseudomonas]|uniref:hypothetical protein n=1 Tax=unclassified Pseudomonas TaxID=196821 RepID=UPI0018678920|nr:MULTISPECIES: hypothetical protein [unclassified Pseudomonas]
MRAMPETLDKLIYLDLEFISRKYEELHGIDPATKTTYQEGGNAGIKALFATAGISTQESRTFSITSRQMLQSTWKQLQENYETFSSFENYQGTKLVWISGKLTVGQWKARGSEVPGHEYFELKFDNERMEFLTQESYFSAGFAQVLRASPALKGNVGIPARCLARVMWHVDDAKNYVACPYVIFEE